MPENRISPVTVANVEEDRRLATIRAQVSPTGTPLVPPRAVPWLMVLSIACGVPAVLVAAGVAIPVLVVTVASTVGAIMLVLLGGSPGLRAPSKPPGSQ